MNPLGLSPFDRMFVIASQVISSVARLAAGFDANSPILWHCPIWMTFESANASSNRRSPATDFSPEIHPNSTLSARNASL